MLPRRYLPATYRGRIIQIYNSPLAQPGFTGHLPAIDPVQTTKISRSSAPSTCLLGTAPSGLKVKILQGLYVRGLRRSGQRDTSNRGVLGQRQSSIGLGAPAIANDQAKRCAETLFFDYRRQHHVAIKVARIFNTYGPRMHPNDGRVVSNFIVQALRGHDITIYGDGLQSRAFCYVDDMIDGLVRLMRTPDDVTGPLNIGNAEEFTMRELATLTVDLIGSRSKIVHRPLPQDDPRQRQPDISRAADLLDWAPCTPLRQGLAKTIGYFEQLFSDPDVREMSVPGSATAV